MIPKIAQIGPYHTDIESKKAYAWCACGMSKSQPFCDGTHFGFGFLPLRFLALETKKVYFCGCKNTSKQPFCDATCVKLQKNLESTGTP